MIKNYFTTALRHLLKNKGTTFINISGLALGIASLLIILVMVRYELSFDRFHGDTNRIYRVVEQFPVDGETHYSSAVAYPLPEAIKTSLASVVQVTVMQYEGGSQLSVYDENTGSVLRQFQEDEGFAYADASFFKVFDFKDVDFHWIAGNPETALSAPFTMVLTESLAKKYFPGENALGKTIRVNNKVDYRITGVVSDFPPNTDFPFRILASYESFKNFFGENFNSDWGSLGLNQCFVVLRKGVAPEEVEKQILAIENSHRSHEDTSRICELQPIKEVHTDTRYGNYKNRTISWETISALFIIGLFLIMTAVINFINLTTAQAAIRAKEVGVRKVMGSNRTQLIRQFLGETFMTTLLAGLLALGAAELVILTQGDLLQVHLKKALIADPFVLFVLMGIIVLVTVLAGMYPALVMSRFNPVTAIRNKVSFGLKKGARIRWGLVTLQFVIAQVFIICTIVVIMQMEYFRSADLGFNKEAILTIRVPENQMQALQTLRNQWKEIPQVEDVSFAYTVPSGENRYGNWNFLRRKGAPDEEGVIYENQSIDEHYLDVYQIPILAGRNFIPSDTAQSIILNRKLAEKLGFATPNDALGEAIVINDKDYTVVGVTENFHTKSLKEDIDYVAFRMNPKAYYHASIKLSMGAGGAANHLQETIGKMEKTWTATFPEYAFNYQFLDDSIAAYYREETRLSKLFEILAGLTIFIGCLGLYGLIAFMAVRRSKEVGIRKVLGASVSNILVLFSKEFVALVLIAFCIAGPIAYYTMQQWLQTFVYKINMGVWVFIAAILASMLIALCTVGYQTIKTAMSNPVDSLKNE